MQYAFVHLPLPETRNPARKLITQQQSKVSIFLKFFPLRYSIQYRVHALLFPVIRPVSTFSVSSKQCINLQKRCATNTPTHWCSIKYQSPYINCWCTLHTLPKVHGDEPEPRCLFPSSKRAAEISVGTDKRKVNEEGSSAKTINKLYWRVTMAHVTFTRSSKLVITLVSLSSACSQPELFTRSVMFPAII